MATLSDLQTFKGHSCVYWNARSLLPKLEEIDRIIDIDKPDIYETSQSWLNKGVDSNQLSLDRYQLYSR